MSDNTEQERAVVEAMAAEIHPCSYPHDAESIIRGLRQRGYVLVERALVVDAAFILETEAESKGDGFSRTADRLRRAAAPGNGEG